MRVCIIIELYKSALCDKHKYACSSWWSLPMVRLLEFGGPKFYVIDLLLCHVMRACRFAYTSCSTGLTFECPLHNKNHSSIISTCKIMCQKLTWMIVPQQHFTMKGPTEYTTNASPKQDSDHRAAWALGWSAHYPWSEISHTSTLLHKRSIYCSGFQMGSLANNSECSRKPKNRQATM